MKSFVASACLHVTSGVKFDVSTYDHISGVNLVKRAQFDSSSWSIVILLQSLVVKQMKIYPESM